MNRIVLSHDELNAGARALDAHLAEGVTAYGALVAAVAAVNRVRSEVADPAEGELRMSPMGTWAQRQGGRWVLMFPSSNEKVYGCDEQVASWPVVGNANAGEQQ
ncbi:hypothetical protein SEA_EPONINE_54 [Mycobacterium phage Eponine]|uniref:Uncharacterized protein n=1 Tax=Mycobacterium phage Eponine TaxID=2708631 RepID=A0A6G6XSY3_9CAUD|nr:hypothetical protein I5G69_gp83 [Mycobacterium phage Eponine]QIG61827.1 hypothetical protein SEA_EPONINE_54 [Mycobacterium phage Eponine]